MGTTVSKGGRYGSNRPITPEEVTPDIPVDPYVYPCSCTPRTLFLEGCKCGAWAAQKSDAEALQRVRDQEARDRLNAHKKFLIKDPTPVVTWKLLCPTCGHPPHPQGTCPDASCNCIDPRAI